MLLFPQRKKRKSAYIEFTPLIDCVFTLLIFFAVTTSEVTKKQGIDLNVPSSQTSMENKANAVMISVDKDQIFFNKERIKLSNIEGEVKERLLEMPDLRVVLNADKETPYENIIKVMDQIRLGGCSNLVLEVKKETITEEK